MVATDLLESQLTRYHAMNRSAKPLEDPASTSESRNQCPLKIELDVESVQNHGQTEIEPKALFLDQEFICAPG